MVAHQRWWSRIIDFDMKCRKMKPWKSTVHQLTSVVEYFDMFEWDDLGSVSQVKQMLIKDPRTLPSSPGVYKIVYAIMEHLVKRLKSDEYFKQWRIALINPIQYSCSLGGLLLSSRKNEVFASLFTGDIVECFKRRLNAIKKDGDYAIINCCTKEGHDEINEILNNQDTYFLSMTHPSSWHYLKDNELQCRVNGKGDTQKFTIEILRSAIVYKNKALRSF